MNEYLEQFAAYQREQGRGPHAVSAYTRDVEAFLAWVVGQTGREQPDSLGEWVLVSPSKARQQINTRRCQRIAERTERIRWARGDSNPFNPLP